MGKFRLFFKTSAWIPASPTTTKATTQISELTSQMDRLSTRWATHPYAQHQCTKCGTEGNSAAKCNVKCTTCNRWGHAADECCSKAPRPTGIHMEPLTPQQDRARPHCAYYNRRGHMRDRCYRNPEGSYYGPHKEQQQQGNLLPHPFGSQSPGVSQAEHPLGPCQQ